MKMNIKHYLLLAISASILSGCTVGGYSKKYGCSGLPDGVVCKTPTQIYDMTNESQKGVYQENLTDKKVDKHDGMFKRDDHANLKDQPKSESEAKMINLFSKPQFESNSNPMPVLEQPKVLRVWIAPWKDQNDTLTWGSYIFTEITPRRWNFGDSVMRNTPVTAPSQADYKSASTTMTAKQAGTQARQASDKEVNTINSNIDNANNPRPQQKEELSQGMQKQNSLAQGGE